MQAQSGVSYIPSSGSVQFADGEKEAIAFVNVYKDVFLTVDSTFSVELTDATYIGVGGTLPAYLKTHLFKDVYISINHVDINIYPLTMECNAPLSMFIWKGRNIK